MAFAENLSKLLAERGETEYRLAKSIGAKQTSIHNWRTGKTRPLAVYREKLAEHFGVSVEDLDKEA